MATRATLYLDDDTEHLLAAYSSDADRETSAIVRRLLDRYREVCERHRPALSIAEWKACCDALNGLNLRLDMGPSQHATIRFMWAEISDGDRLDGLGAKWGIDAQALSVRIRDMSYAEQVSLADTVERFWCSVSRGEQPLVPGETREPAPATRKRRGDV